MIDRIILEGCKIIPKSISRWETGDLSAVVLTQAETACRGEVYASKRRREPAISALKKFAKLVNKPMGYFFDE
jgi:hypothetical protein